MDGFENRCMGGGKDVFMDGCIDVCMIGWVLKLFGG
jgi:hypothetical protein